MPTPQIDRSRRPDLRTAPILVALTAAPALMGCVQILGDYEPSGCDRADCVTTWARRFGDEADQDATAVAVTADDGIVVTGHFAGTIDFGGGALKTAGDKDIFVARLDRTGKHVWSVSFGGPTIDLATSVAVDPEGDILLTGVFSSKAMFDGKALSSAGGNDVFVAKLSPAGELLWVKPFGGEFDQIGIRVAPGVSGEILVTGCMVGSMDIGLALPLGAFDSADAFGMRLDKDGNVLWGAAAGGSGSDCGYRVASDSAGNMLFAGVFESTIAFDAAHVHSTNGGKDIFVTKLSPDGVPLWSQSYGGIGEDVPGSLLVPSDNRFILAGSYSATVDFNGTMPLTAAKDLDPFVIALDGDGTTRWSRGLGGAESERLVAGTLDHAGDVLVAGSSGPPGSTNVDPFVTKMSRGGDLRWAVRWSAISAQEAVGIAADSKDDVVIAGPMAGSLEIAGTPLESAGGHDVFVAKLGIDTASPR